MALLFLALVTRHGAYNAICVTHIESHAPTPAPTPASPTQCREMAEMTWCVSLYTAFVFTSQFLWWHPSHRYLATAVIRDCICKFSRLHSSTTPDDLLTALKILLCNEAICLSRNKWGNHRRTASNESVWKSALNRGVSWLLLSLKQSAAVTLTITQEYTLKAPRKHNTVNIIHLCWTE